MPDLIRIRLMTTSDKPDQIAEKLSEAIHQAGLKWQLLDQSGPYLNRRGDDRTPPQYRFYLEFLTD